MSGVTKFIPRLSSFRRDVAMGLGSGRHSILRYGLTPYSGRTEREGYVVRGKTPFRSS